MKQDHAQYEGYICGSREPRWNQSYYYQAYDAVTRTGAFIRIGILENQNEVNTWLIVFRDGRPLFTRTNLNLPYTAERPATGIHVAGLHVQAEVPLKKTRIRFDSVDFSLDLVWNELAPMQDCIAMSADKNGSLASEIAHVHLEGTCTISGHLVHRGQRQAVNGKGFRDVAAGVRNWDALKHYRLAWPVFEDGTAFAGIHGQSTGGHSMYMRMCFDGRQWLRVKHLDDHMSYDAEGFAATDMRWSFIDENDRRVEMTGKPLFRWLFPFDTFVLCEQLMEYRLADGTLGYGLYETGYRLPWNGA